MICYRNLSHNRHDDIVFYYCGRQKCPPLHFWSGIRDHYLIHYIIRGKGVFKLQNKTYNLKQKDGFVIYPGELVFYQADRDEPWEYCWFSFYGIKAAAYLSAAGLTPERRIFSYDRDNDLKKCILNMIKAKDMKKGKEFYLMSLLYEFFFKIAQINNRSNGASSKITNAKEIYVKKAIEFIEKNFSANIKIKDIARHIGIDRKYLHSLFREFVHAAPQEFLINYRLNKACELLRESNLKIREIAHSVGYEDPLLFSKIFKKKKGISPAEYRKVYRPSDV